LKFKKSEILFVGKERFCQNKRKGDSLRSLQALEIVVDFSTTYSIAQNIMSSNSYPQVENSKIKMQKSKLKIKDQKFPNGWKKQIEESGKLFEQEVVLYIQNHGFGYVVPNDAFLDVESGESRELDVFAIAGRKIGQKMNFIFPIALIAIKKITLVCFMRNEIMTRYTLGDIHISGMPKTIYSKGEETEFTDYINLEKIHHFYKYNKISSQFWTPLEKSRDKKGDYFYRELIFPLVKSLIAQIREHEEGWYFDPEGEPINLQIYYPIIVVENLWECNITKNGPKYRKVHKIGFVSRYSSEKISGTYLIDICDREGLKDLLKIINKEEDQIVKVIKKKIKIIENSAFAEAKQRIDESKKQTT